MKHLIFLALLCVALLAQKPKPTIEACGLGLHKDHPCHCVEHTSQVQTDWMVRCQGVNGRTVEQCLKEMPVEIRDHCSVAEHYGNWNNEGDPMPQQCSMACKRSDCRCDDGPVCHYGHSAKDHAE
jgi:hypothetical protein